MSRSSIYQIRVTLDGSKPPIWRKLAVPSSIVLGELHEVIQIAMGWTNSHMHQFILRGKKPKPRPLPPRTRGTSVAEVIDLPDGRKGCVLSTRPAGNDEPETPAKADTSWPGTSDRYFLTKVTPWGEPTELEGEDEEAVTLGEVCPKVKSKLIYEYDFGDGWEHTIEVQKIIDPEPGVEYPVCLGGKKACPPEDCGGIWGYYHLLETITDPDADDHEDMVEWLGVDFDPDAFDLEEANTILMEWRKQTDE